MRIRSIKPEFWRSADITALDWEVRLIFIGLWSYVDDNGVGLDDVRLITADLFALEDDTLEVRARVRDALATLSRAFLLTRFEVAGRRYFYVVTWDRHQKIDKPSKARYPLPNEAEPPVIADSEAVDDSDSRVSRESGASDSRLEQGNRGTEEQIKNSCSTSSNGATVIAIAGLSPGLDLFDDFWTAFPKKVAKRAARKRFETLVKRGTDPQQIINGAKRYADEVRGKEPQYVKQPDGWLLAGRWEDEPSAKPDTLPPYSYSPWST